MIKGCSRCPLALSTAPYCSHRFRFPTFYSRQPTSLHFYTLSLHDALPISFAKYEVVATPGKAECFREAVKNPTEQGVNIAIDRKSTRLNSSHTVISYAVFCLKKKTGVIPTNKTILALVNDTSQLYVTNNAA